MTLHMLSIGNDYPGTSYSLPDCCRDAGNMFAVMEPWLAPHSERLFNEECKLVNLMKWLKSIRKLAKTGDAFVVYNSGHGTSQGKNQGIVLHGGFVLWEAKIRELLAPLTPAVLISDSCFAGGLSRNPQQQRFVPLVQLAKKQHAPTGRLPKRQHDYFAACDAGETAASTGVGGAFTLAALDALAEATPKTTMLGIHRAVRKVLPNDEYPQTPQFVATDKGFSRKTLGSFMK